MAKQSRYVVNVIEPQISKNPHKLSYLGIYLPILEE